MKVLSIGYGRNLFDVNNFEHQRLDRCAREVESLDHIIFTNQSDGLERLVTKNGFILHPTNSKHKLLMIFDAIKIGSHIIKQKKIDVISSQDVFETGLIGLILKIRFGQVILQVQEHADVLASKYWKQEKFSNRLWYHLAFIVLRKSDIIRVVSDRTRYFLRDHLGSEKTIKKLPVVIDTASFVLPSNNEGVERKDTFTFITVARFVPQKNFPLMLKAFAKIYQKNSQSRLRIFGSGPLQKEVENLIVSLNITTAVELHGWTDDVAGEMARADAYLLTSNYEGWARVLIEAMLLKLPIVTTDVGCVHEVVKDRQHGTVVSVDDLEGLVNAMNEIVTNKELYSSFKTNLEALSLESIPGTNIDEYAGLWVKTLC